MSFANSPTSGRVSSTYGPRNAPAAGASTDHKGIDIAAPPGTPVVVPAGGKVSYAGYKNGYGNVVYVEHPDGTQTRYGHLKDINVKAGETLSEGNQLGTVGNTGVSSGAHLHYEIRDKDGKPIDPATQNPDLGKRGAKVAAGEPTTGPGTTTPSPTPVPTPSPTPKPPVPVSSQAGIEAKTRTLTMDDLAKETSVYKDWRVRLRLMNGQTYGAGSEILGILNKTDGIIFPYTPASFQFQQTNDYSSHSLSFANMDYYAFQRNTMPQFSLSGEFTAQTPEQSLYCLAVIHFFRSYTKIRYGETDDKRGELPPRFLLDAFGQYNIRSLPVYVTAYGFDLPDNATYVEVDFSGNKTRIPASFNCSITLQASIHPSMWNYPGGNITADRQQRMFNWDDFATGKLYKFGGWI
jgi:hypothetical protein